MDIQELAIRKAQAQQTLQMLGMSNVAWGAEEQLKQAARYELAQRAYEAAAREFDEAVSKMSTEELIALTSAVLGEK